MEEDISNLFYTKKRNFSTRKTIEMKNILTVLFMSVWFGIFAQIQHGGTPKSIIYNLAGNIPTFITSETNVTALRAEDETLDKIKDMPWRYGYIHYVDISIEEGRLTELANGDRIWQIEIISSGAQTINFTFDKYRLVPGAELYIYTEGYERIIGAFTHENNKEHGFLTTTLLEADRAIIELYEPREVVGQSELHLQRVVHGYRSLDYKQKYIGDSGNCNNNVICPEGDNWRDQIRSVGILLTQNNLAAGFCSGALINNSCQDETPFFLTANHCGADDPTTVVGFNFESTTCTGNSGPYLNNTISGVSLRASNGGSDVMLLELSSVPPASYNVYYSGWDRTGNISTGHVGIHHPAGDLKKITFDTNAGTQGTFSGAACWRVGNWEDGTTEGGSSGSPLFNSSGLIIGQLYGGSASCSSITEDFYGRFDVSWDGGSNPGNELKTWLDPCNTGATTLQGYDPNAIVLNEDASITFSQAPAGTLCGDTISQKLILRNRGIADLTNVEIQYNLNGNFQTYNWTGLLTSNQSELIDLGDVMVGTGVYTFEAYISFTNLSQDEDTSNDAVSVDFDILAGVNVVIGLTTNFAGDENSIEIRDENNVLIEFEDNFDNTESYNFTYCLPKGAYCVTIFDSGGDGLSPTFFFDPGNYRLEVDGEEIYNGDDIGEEYTYCFDKSEPASGIRNQNAVDFALYPNPAQNGFTIDAKGVIQWIQVVDVLGRQVYENQVYNNLFFVNTNDWSRGVYLVNVTTPKGTGTIKLLLQ